MSGVTAGKTTSVRNGFETPCCQRALTEDLSAFSTFLLKLLLPPVTTLPFGSSQSQSLKRSPYGRSLRLLQFCFRATLAYTLCAQVVAPCGLLVTRRAPGEGTQREVNASAVSSRLQSYRLAQGAQMYIPLPVFPEGKMILRRGFQQMSLKLLWMVSICLLRSQGLSSQ